MDYHETASADEQWITGRFWIAGGPERQGHFRAEGRSGRVKTLGVVRESRALQVVPQGLHSLKLTPSADVSDVVADSAPIPVMGALDDGRLLTLLDGRLADPGFGSGQTLVGRLLWGANVPSAESRFVAARMTVPYQGYWTMLGSDEAKIAVDWEGPRGRLAAVVREQDVWLELALPEGLTHREWERRFWYPVLILMALWTNEPMPPQRVQLKCSRDDSWAELIVRGEEGRRRPSPSAFLLDPEDLDLECVASALTLFERLSPIPEVASTHRAYELPIQLALLSYASALEGLHTRCYQQVKSFPHLSKNGAKEAAQAAAAAAAKHVAPLGDEEKIAEILYNEFRGFNRPTFANRLQELGAKVNRVAPGLLGQDVDAWVKALKDARNVEAHRMEWKPEDFDVAVDSYYKLTVSADWASRICMLSEVGLAPERLRAALRHHDRFHFALANMDRGPAVWPGSRLGEFLASFNGEADGDGGSVDGALGPDGEA